MDNQSHLHLLPPHRLRRFGARPPIASKLNKTLKFRDYLGLTIPAPPIRVDWTRGFNINYGMALNDQLGDCTEAKKVHAIQAWTLCNGRMVNIPDSVTLAAYEADGGYIPGDSSTDNGEDMISNLNAWRKNGFGGVPLTAYTAVDPLNFLHVQQAIYLFGLVDIGFSVPQSAMDQNAAGQVWDVVANDGGIVGGHDVVVPTYDASQKLLTCLTWGGRQLMTLAFWQKYVTETYALLSPVWTARRGVDPSGFDTATLLDDLKGVAV